MSYWVVRKQIYVEDNALKEWKRIIFTIVDKRIKIYSQNTNLLLPGFDRVDLQTGIKNYSSLYLACNDQKAFTSSDQSRCTLWSCQNVCDALSYLLDNIYIRFGSYTDKLLESRWVQIAHLS